MSLGKLLATGRSLVGGPSLGRYDISSRNRLPKFGGGGNPFAQPAQPDAAFQPVETALKTAPGPAAPAVPEPVATPEAPPNKTQVIEYKKTQRIASLAELKPRKDWVLIIKRWSEAVLALGCFACAKLLGWFKAASRLLLARFRRPEPKPVFPRFGKRAVQTELSLDKVKVVRNDLEESDLEIVTGETATSTQVAPQAAPASPKRGPLPVALKKLTGRLIGTTPPT